MNENKENLFLKNFNFVVNSTLDDPNSERPFNFLKKSPDKLMLINLSLQPENEMLKNFCYQEEMIQFWDDIWKLMGKDPTFPEAQKNPLLVYHELKPQKKILSYELVCGMSLYNKTYQYPVAMHLEMLHDAARYHNFAALESLAYLYGNQINAGNWVEPKSCLAELVKSAEIHGSPGYLLCAKMCIDYSCYYFKKADTKNYQQCLTQCLAYLYAAELLESFCQAEIHNAYYGKNIFNVLLKKYFSQICIKNPNIIAQTKSLGQKIADQWVKDDFVRLFHPKH
jgi:hypothetical protein